MNFRIQFIAFTFLYCFFISESKSQTPTQTIRGSVVDKISQSTLPGANIVLLNSDPLNGSSADENGNFRLSKVPLGLQTLIISFLG